MDTLDLIIIGAGPAGYRGAETAGKAGLKTLLIEKRQLGGVCLNEGCIPSKAFLHATKIIESVSGAQESGVIFKEVGIIDQAQVVKYKDKVIKRLIAGVRASIKAAGVEIISGEGYIEKKTAEGFLLKVGENEYIAKNVLIATGSEPLLPPIEGLKEGYQNGYVLTNREILSLSEIPKKLVVVGGGVIGLEMGSYFALAGANVTVVEMLDSIGGPLDGEIASLLKKALEKKGIKFETGAKVIKISEKEVIFEREGIVSSVDFDKVLVSIGRKAVTQNIGLENIGVATNRGIITNELMATNVEGVYAAGDVTGAYMLAHVAYREADVAVNNILKREDTMSYNAVPSVIYTTPEVAMAGETEESALNKGYRIKAVKLSLMFSGRYVAESDDRSGIMKLVYDENKGTLIGASVIGPYSSEYIAMISAFIGLKIPVEHLKKQIYPHPTVSEVFRDALFEI